MVESMRFLFPRARRAAAAGVASFQTCVKISSAAASRAKFSYAVEEFRI